MRNSAITIEQFRAGWRCDGGGLWYVSGEVAPGWSTRPCGWTGMLPVITQPEKYLVFTCPKCEGNVVRVEVEA